MLKNVFMRLRNSIKRVKEQYKKDMNRFIRKLFCHVFLHRIAQFKIQNSEL
jgi:hypothetical protein